VRVVKIHDDDESCVVEALGSKNGPICRTLRVKYF